jgi:oligopeptide/dipeptide ABC transporter ATP-binding protein
LRTLGVAATRHGSPHPIVVDVTVAIAPGETLGVVGESGSGKSMSIKAAMRLLPRGLTSSGEILFEDRDVLSMGRKELATYRSREVGLIHQDPRAHINPTRTIGQFLIEGVVETGQMNASAATDAACALMHDVGISDPERRLNDYPHQLSGGLLQRVMIVAAVLPGPKLIFADEPTTALDVTVQSDVMAILLEQVEERDASLLFVTHDLDLAAAVTDRIAVMYAGSVVETGTATEVCEHPRHPYTAALLRARPSTTEVRRLETIPGRPIGAFEVERGCAFAARCPYADDRCHAERPELRVVDEQLVACHRTEEIAGELIGRAS